MIKEDLEMFFKLRIIQLKKIKDGFGVTNSQSYNRSMEWIDSIIAINERLLGLIK